MTCPGERTNHERRHGGGGRGGALRHGQPSDNSGSLKLLGDASDFNVEGFEFRPSQACRPSEVITAQRRSRVIPALSMATYCSRLAATPISGQSAASANFAAASLPDPSGSSMRFVIANMAMVFLGHLRDPLRRRNVASAWWHQRWAAVQGQSRSWHRISRARISAISDGTALPSIRCISVRPTSSDSPRGNVWMQHISSNDNLRFFQWNGPMADPGCACTVHDGNRLLSFNKKLQYLVRHPNRFNPPRRSVCQR